MIGALALDISTGEVDEYGYKRLDNVTDGILATYRQELGDQLTKDEIFFYVYGLLHDPAYRATYAADLKKMLPQPRQRPLRPATGSCRPWAADPEERWWRGADRPRA